MRRWLLRLAVVAGVAMAGLEVWVRTAPVPDLAPPVSATVLDRDGRLLRAYTVADGRWRLPVTVEQVDPRFVAQLIAYEDKRFHEHGGVDLRAMTRAAWQLATNGRIVSGGSTLTMQVARLLREAPSGRVSDKLAQVRLALALERQLTKTEILDLYLRLAPYGGNVEGVRAASLTWFGKEPRRLTAAEAALLVALPQAPESRRPDRYPGIARHARDRVLARAEARGVLSPGAVLAARRERIPTARQPFPQLAPHLADRLRRPGEAVTTTIDAALQAQLEALVAERAPALGKGLSAAVIVAEHATGEVRARVGSPGLDAWHRGGFLDMTRAVRSPGSTLKPFIYGLAFEGGIAHPETLIDDRPMDFRGYRPGNFDRTHRGTLSVREALQLSLNVPAVAVLDQVGPARLLTRLRRAGAEPRLASHGAPGLAVALGGLGLTLEELTGLYAGLANGGEARALRDLPLTDARPVPRLLSAEAAWHVGDVLAGAPPPDNAAAERLAFKTGTSYGYRDAWAVGFDGTHVVGVWVGRPDAASAPGILGQGTAAPLLFEAFGRLKSRPDPLPPPPPSALTLTNAELPLPMRRFRHPGMRRKGQGAAPRIAYPPQGATVNTGGGPLVLKVAEGRPPFRWLANGAPLAVDARSREVLWTPGGPGAVTLSVIDRDGRAARTRAWVE